MKRLFTIDMKDYNPEWPHSTRPSARGIIELNGKLALIHNEKYDYYMFPGGGIEEGESHEEALIREVKEEAGLTVIPESIRAYGSALRLSSSRRFENTIFEQENFYYTCQVQDKIEVQQLDSYETEEGYSLVLVSLEEALQKNRYDNHGEENGTVWIERETRVIEVLLEKNK